MSYELFAIYASALSHPLAMHGWYARQNRPGHHAVLPTTAQQVLLELHDCHFNVWPNAFLSSLFLSLVALKRVGWRIHISAVLAEVLYVRCWVYLKGKNETQKGINSCKLNFWTKYIFQSIILLLKVMNPFLFTCNLIEQGISPFWPIWTN